MKTNLNAFVEHSGETGRTPRSPLGNSAVAFRHSEFCQADAGRLNIDRDPIFLVEPHNGHALEESIIFTSFTASRTRNAALALASGAKRDTGRRELDACTPSSLRAYPGAFLDAGRLRHGLAGELADSASPERRQLGPVFS